jgi:uncharacterized membrane protein YdfJ with MMPL/SSD domain
VRAATLERLLAREELQAWIDARSGRCRLQVQLATTRWKQKSELFDFLRHFDATMLGHHELHLAGPGHTAWRVEQIGIADLGKGGLLSALAIVVLLALSFRSPRACALALVASLLPLLCVAGIMGWTSTPWSIALLPLPGVLFGIALDDSVHLLWRNRKRERRAALPACLATTTLVASSVATLAWSSFLTNRAFGSLLAIGLLLALAADLTLLPALLKRSRRTAAR